MTPMNPHTPAPSTSTPVHGHADGGVWPPPLTAPDAELEQRFVNTSGTDGPLPPEIARLKFSWGAFGISFWWLAFHNMVPAALAVLVGVVGVKVIDLEVLHKPYSIADLLIWIVYFYCGFQGHKLAWRKRRYDSLEQYFKVESAWKNWTIGLMCVGVIFGILAVLLPMLASHRV